MELLDIKKYFPDFDYPKQLKKIAELDLADFDFWFLMDVELAKSYTEGMAKRFPARHLAPFAKRGDCDDVACFEMEKPGKVVIVHDFCDPGYEKRQEYDTFWDWFRADMEEMITETEAED